MSRSLIACVLASLFAPAAFAADDAAARKKMADDIMAVVEAKYQAKIDELNKKIAQGAGGVALVDLTSVAKALGRDTQIAGEVQRNNQVMVADVLKNQKDLQAAFESEKAKLGANPTDEQKKALEKRAAELNNQLRTTASQADLRAREFQARLVTNFREEVRPVALKIAQARNAHIVMIVNDNLLAADTSVDITNDVIAALRASGSALGATNMPAPAPAPAPAAPAAPAKK
jgi:Skp family chaperone for outer membrane proteins